MITMTKFVLFSIFVFFLIINQIYAHQCNYTLAESIPEGLNLTNGDVFKAPATHLTWLDLINNAQRNISIAQFYFSLRCLDVLNRTIESCQPGEQILKAFEKAAERGVDVKIVINGNSSQPLNEDLSILKKAGAKIKFLDFDRLIGAGILHTKFIIVDDSKFYLGSSNMDWRSLTQVKELGIVIKDHCPVLGGDLKKIFSVYWYLSDQEMIPNQLPHEFETHFNMHQPLSIKLNDVDSHVFLTSSPLQMNTKNRTNDIDAILHIINKAKKFIKFSVMDYSPSFLYGRNHYWPVIDNAIRLFKILFFSYII